MTRVLLIPSATTILFSFKTKIFKISHFKIQIYSLYWKKSRFGNTTSVFFWTIPFDWSWAAATIFRRSLIGHQTPPFFPHLLFLPALKAIWIWDRSPILRPSCCREGNSSRVNRAHWFYGPGYAAQWRASEAQQQTISICFFPVSGVQLCSTGLGWDLLRWLGSAPHFPQSSPPRQVSWTASPHGNGRNGKLKGTHKPF